MIINEHFNSSRMKCRVKNVDVIVLIVVRKGKTQVVQCSKGREQNFQFWKLLAVVLDTNIKSVNKVHKRSDETLVMLPLSCSFSDDQVSFSSMLLSMADCLVYMRGCEVSSIELFNA